MQVNPTPQISLPHDAAFGPYLRVKLSSGVLAAAGATDKEIGTLLNRVVITGLGQSTVATVITRRAPGIIRMIADGAISQYGAVYGAAAGKVSATWNGNYIGTAQTATTTDGDQVDVERGETPALWSVGEAHTADDILTAVESGSVHTTVGAQGTVVFTLPAALVGMQYRFKVGAAQELRIDPDGTETIALPSTGVQSGAGEYLTANAAGETVEIFCDTAGEWSVFGYTGTWAAA